MQFRIVQKLREHLNACQVVVVPVFILRSPTVHYYLIIYDRFCPANWSVICSPIVENIPSEYLIVTHIVSVYNN